MPSGMQGAIVAARSRPSSVSPLRPVKPGRRRRLLEPPRVDVAQEGDQALEVDVAIVVHGQVASIGTVEEPTVLDLPGHPLHVLRVHGVVAGADHERRDADLVQVGGAVPRRELAARSQFARTLHRETFGFMCSKAIWMQSGHSSTGIRRTCST